MRLPVTNTYSTLATTGANATADFVAATNGGVSFGGTVGALSAWGISSAIWGDTPTIRKSSIGPHPQGLRAHLLHGNNAALQLNP